MKTKVVGYLNHRATTRKLMHLWCDAGKVDYSIEKQFYQIEKLLQTIHYPTTNRLPRLL